MSELPSKLRECLQAAGVDPSSVRALCRALEGEIFGMRTDGSRAFSLWNRLRETLPDAGYFPVMLGGDEDLDALREQVQAPYCGTPEQILEEAKALDVTAWLALRQDELVDELLEFGGDLYDAADHGIATEPREFYRGIPRGSWPDDARPTSEFFVLRESNSDKPSRLLYVGLVPTPVAWEVPAYLRFGYFNECPPSAVHVALMKHWQEHFGSVVFAMTKDTVETLVDCPPTSQSSAMRLARDQYLYCRDIIDQGTETAEALAATLLDGTTWFFWWD